ncbi:unnamed protein product [Moneuplotes crassus]|uniref:Uncharacterized protein n=1 Tax=Euplotes crassus TaxID=5936 RepID=A0AAD1Y9U5_EUPCR|nr:unnamed protein product [Moneuplotes crassus]
MTAVKMAMADTRDTVYISSLITQGARTPLFTADPEYQVTGVSFDQGPGKITVTGERSLASRGAQAKNDYGNGKFFETNYIPDDIFVRTINDQKSIISAYSYLLGCYPDSVNGLSLESDIEEIKSVPVTNYDVDNVRPNLNLGNPRGETAQARIHPGNPDALFLTQLGRTYPGQKEKIDQQLFEAKREYEQTHGTRFYENFARAIHKPVGNMNFYSIHKYADDVIAAEANGEFSAVNLSDDLHNQLDVYFGHYFGNGLFRDYALTRAFSHTYLSSMVHELQLKMQDDQTGEFRGDLAHNAKQSVYLGNHLTLISALHLFNEVESYRVDFNDELRFQLFQKDGRYLVRSLLNDKPLRLEGVANSQGEIEWSAFRDYICSKLYFGNVDSVRDGTENPQEFMHLKESCDSFISKGYYRNDKVLLELTEAPEYLPDEPTSVPREQVIQHQASGNSILTNNFDDGVRRQSVDINVGLTNQRVDYAWNKPIKFRQTQWEEISFPMKEEFSFGTLTKQEVGLNQYRKVKIAKTVNEEITLPERHTFNFGSELLKTREVLFNSVNFLRLPEINEHKLFLADRHKFSLDKNPRLSTKRLSFNYVRKLQIPQTTKSPFALPQRHVFDYSDLTGSNKEVHFDHIKKIKVKQAETYNINLKNFNFDRLDKIKAQHGRHSAVIETQAGSDPLMKISTTGQRDEAHKVNLGGNIHKKPDYVAPIRIKQEYDPYTISFTEIGPVKSYHRELEETEFISEYPHDSSKSGRNYPSYSSSSVGPFRDRESSQDFDWGF